MANTNSTYQQQNTVSINRYKLIDIAEIHGLDEDDYRVLLILFTQLNGYRYNNNPNSKDPRNFKKIDAEKIGDTLEISKKRVKKSIRLLYNLGLLDKGDNDSVKNGYRFTF